MQQFFEQDIKKIFDRAMNAAEIAIKSSKAKNLNTENNDLRGHADIIVLNASERLLDALRSITQINEVKPSTWVIGDFTQRTADHSLKVREAAVDAALLVFNESIDEADGQFRAPSWVE